MPWLSMLPSLGIKHDCFIKPWNSYKFQSLKAQSETDQKRNLIKSLNTDKQEKRILLSLTWLISNLFSNWDLCIMGGLSKWLMNIVDARIYNFILKISLKKFLVYSSLLWKRLLGMNFTCITCLKNLKWQ